MSAKLELRPAILLVDDHAANLMALEAVLGTNEYRLFSAASGPEALDILQREDIALILLDVQMPGMDGYEVMRRIKSDERTKHVPVILITAIYTEDPHVKRGYEVGAIDYFAKPFNPDILRAKVEIYAELYAKSLLLERRDQQQRDMERQVAKLHKKLQERELDLKQEEERRNAEIRTVLESIPDAVYVGDLNGVTRCNSEALALFGFNNCKELNEHFGKLGQRIQMRYLATDKPIPEDDQPYAHALRGEHFFAEIKARPVSAPEDVVIACAASPITLNDQIIGGVVVNMKVPTRAQP